MQFDPSQLTFNEAGLIPAIAQDHLTGEVLMMAWMNAEAVQRTIDTRAVTYWSRSRAEFWVKGLTSGHTQKLIEMRMDCDVDCLLVLIEQVGAAFHTNRRSCFYRRVDEGDIETLSDPL